MVFVEEQISEPVENGGGVSTRHKNPGPGAYTTVSVGDSLERERTKRGDHEWICFGLFACTLQIFIDFPFVVYYKEF